MKVALINNMNNNMFTLLRYLLGAGWDADLIVGNEGIGHFRPEDDTFHGERYRSRIRAVEWGDPYSFYLVPASKVRRDLEGYDVVVGCGYLPAFMNRIGRRLDLFVPYGADFYEAPFCPFALSAKWPFKRYLAWSQQQGILHAKVKVQTSIYYDFEELEREFGGGFTRMPLLYLYLPEYDDLSGYSGPLKARYDAIRNRHDIVVFHHARHIWKTRLSVYADKGNDLLIRGFAEYAGSTRKRPALMLFEYGVDVSHSKDLVRELGIESFVHWMPLSSRKDIMYCLGRSDIACDEFHSGVLNGIACESIAMRVPLISNLDAGKLDTYYGFRDFPEVFPARSPEEVCGRLMDHERSGERYRECALRSREWYDRNLGEGLAVKYRGLIERARTLEA